jgi:hypothetical protein
MLTLGLLLGLGLLTGPPAQAAGTPTYSINTASGSVPLVAGYGFNFGTSGAVEFGTFWPITFYGQTYSNFYLTHDGRMTFGAPPSPLSSAQPCLPNASAPTLDWYAGDLTDVTAQYGFDTATTKDEWIRLEGTDAVDGKAFDVEILWTALNPTIQVIYGPNQTDDGSYATIGTDNGSGLSTQSSCHSAGAVAAGTGVMIHPETTTDALAPTIAPAAPIIAGASLSAGKHARVNVLQSWTATEAGSAINYYQAGLSEDGSPFAPFHLQADLTDSVVSRLALGHTYDYYLMAQDAAFNRASTVTSTFMLGGLQEADAAYTGTWTGEPTAGAWGGGIETTGAKGASATFDISGSSAAVVAEKGPTLGSAAVYLDGVFVRNISFHRATDTARRLVWKGAFADDSNHTIEIVNKGVSARPEIDIDGVLTTG